MAGPSPASPCQSSGPAGTVSRVDRDGRDVELIGTGVSPSGVAVWADEVYWTNGGMAVADGTIAAASVDGSDARILLEGLPQPAGIAVNEDYVYYSGTSASCTGSSSSPPSCFSGGVNRMPRAGGDVEVIDGEATPAQVVLDERGVYWIAMLPLRAMFAPFDGGPLHVIADLRGEDGGPIAVDADAFYFSSSSNGRVMKVPLAGGAPQALVTDLGSVGEIAVDRDWVYVAATSLGQILRVAKDGSASRPEGPITGPCPDPIGTPEEIAATPREDASSELLALALDEGELVATQDTYERVIADVAAIRELEPMLDDIEYRPPNDGQTLMLSSDEKTRQVIEADEYSAWDCLNEFYGLESLSTISDRFISLTLKGRYQLAILAELYAQLPGIKGADPTASLGDGSTICAMRDRSMIEYVVDRAGGDCPAGCTTHEAHRFLSRGPGDVEALDTWSGETGAPAPEWFTRVCR